ncbi:ABC transporter substrate-binding protein [Mesorhizobium sp. BAC0120]|uniref:ABC transporter substrate-binding protein n=1 Tax=Mesorhizobium sp. BAC0120 TaxID=3090670 RepID=UPI00298D3B71|nr:ABC transporter substrate-binding protein [Mesorhizobium sp. BAC0120]MDW6026490.1 ABC transporter substrate-binding protein [Mesorhizobium sp. BAC0120]
MTEERDQHSLFSRKISRRTALKGAGAAASLALAPGFVRYAQAESSEPIKIGFQAHRTGIGAAYGRWYEITTNAAVKQINDAGGINGRPVEVIVEDDGTDPARGAEVVGKFANQHKTDVVYGTLFSHVVVGSAPTAGELKIPYYVVSEGYHVASGKLNRWCFQPGITDVRSQVTAMAPWMAATLGKKVTMIFPDYAFGYDHRDYLPPALKKQGAEVIAQLAIPPTETSFTRYFPQIPAETEVLYHVMVGPAVLTFVKELGEFYGSNKPQLFGFIDSLEAVDINSPGLEFLDGSHFWEGSPRYAQPNDSDAQKAYRAAVGIDDNGASVKDPKDVSTAAHMFGCWETLYVIKQAMEAAGYKGPGDRAKLVEATEALTSFPEGKEHPQGDKTFNGKLHQCYGHQNISKLEGGKLKVVHRTKIEDGLYEPEGNYTTMAL